MASFYFILFIFIYLFFFNFWRGGGAFLPCFRLQTSSSPPVIFIAGRPKAALLLWFFGDFRCGALLFVVIHVI